ncbi:MAG: MtrB/PioB family outer membrane beta-barrel protein, partial [Rhodoferax sp.]
MQTRPRLKLVAASVGLALAQWGAGPALADSAVGVDMALGNALNPPGRPSVPRPLEVDADDTVRHSPSGQLYNLPYQAPEDRPKTDGGWEYSGQIEAGVLAGQADLRNAISRKYRDSRNGLALNYFEVESDKPSSANYVQAFGGGTGMQDQFYGVQFGRYNDWKMKLFYNETVHVFSDNWKSLYNGEGSGDLTTGLAKPKLVSTPLTLGTTGGSALASGSTYVGPTITAANNCSAALPCWSYGGKIYQNGVAVAAINGTTGTANASTGAIAAVAGLGATGAV